MNRGAGRHAEFLATDHGVFRADRRVAQHLVGLKQHAERLPYLLHVPDLCRSYKMLTRTCRESSDLAMIFMDMAMIASNCCGSCPSANARCSGHEPHVTNTAESLNPSTNVYLTTLIL